MNWPLQPTDDRLDILRVHDVKSNVSALRAAEAVLP